LNELKELFEKMTVDNLSYVLKALGIKATGKIKSEKIRILLDFYSNKECIKNIWESLNAYEKELLTCIVQSDYHPDSADLDKIVKKHSVKLKGYSYYNRSRYYEEGSKLNAIVIERRVPRCIRLELAKLIPKYKPEFEILTDMDDLEECEGQIIGRADRYSDFDMLIKFINNQKVPATKANGLMSKSSLIKYYKIAGYEEIFKNDIFEMSEIRKSSDTTVSYGMIQLLLAADVLEINKDIFKLGENASCFIGLDMSAKAKFLFDIYIKNQDTIDECKSITANKFQFSRSRYNLTDPRQVIIDSLKMCSAGEWIIANEFNKQIRRMNHSFLRSVINDVYMRDDYHRQYYYSPGWNEFECYFIDTMLMEYLSVLGAVDVVTNNCSDDYGMRVFPVVEYFRVTTLGLFLFGITDEYISGQKSISADEKGIVVQPNFDIIVPNGTQRMAHEIYFERFLTKTTDDAEVSVFKLDFSGIVRALEIGIKIMEIRDYMQNCSTVPIPENIISAFNEWEAQSKRIRIRTVTIVETDDHFILEEIKNYRGMKENILGEVRNAIVITPQKSLKVKKLIEKNKRLCIISD